MTSAATWHDYIMPEHVYGLTLTGKVPQATPYVVGRLDH